MWMEEQSTSYIPWHSHNNCSSTYDQNFLPLNAQLMFKVVIYWFHYLWFKCSALRKMRWPLKGPLDTSYISLFKKELLKFFYSLLLPVRHYFTNSFSSFRHRVLGQLPRKNQPHSCLDITGQHRSAVVSLPKSCRFPSKPLENVVDKRVHDGHRFGRDPCVWMDLLQHLVDEVGVLLFLPWLPLLLPLPSLLTPQRFLRSVGWPTPPSLRSRCTSSSGLRWSGLLRTSSLLRHHVEPLRPNEMITNTRTNVGVVCGNAQGSRKCRSTADEIVFGYELHIVGMRYLYTLELGSKLSWVQIVFVWYVFLANGVATYKFFFVSTLRCVVLVKAVWRESNEMLSNR